jgi:hypothetical protein
MSPVTEEFQNLLVLSSAAGFLLSALSFSALAFFRSERFHITARREM